MLRGSDGAGAIPGGDGAAVADVLLAAPERRGRKRGRVAAGTQALARRGRHRPWAAVRRLAPAQAQNDLVRSEFREFRPPRKHASREFHRELPPRLRESHSLAGARRRRPLADQLARQQVGPQVGPGAIPSATPGRTAGRSRCGGDPPHRGVREDDCVWEGRLGQGQEVPVMLVRYSP